MDLAEAFSSLETAAFWVLFPLLRMLAVLLLALRKRAGWLVLLIEPVLSMVLMVAGGGFSFGVLLLPAIVVYGWWRWRKRAADGRPPVHAVTRRDGIAAAVFVALVLVFYGVEVVPMMVVHMTDVAAIVHTLLVNALTMLLYFGLARGVVEAWWLGIALALMGLGNVVVGRGSMGFDNPVWLLQGLALTVLNALLHFYGWAKWRAASKETAVAPE